jgi:HEAT repeat protein
MRCRFLILAVFILVAEISAAAQKSANDAASELTRILQDLRASTDAKGNACMQLMKMGAAAAPAVPALIAQLKDPNEILRDFAVTTLSKIGAVAAPALPALRQTAESDPSNDIRQLAADAVKKISAATGTASQRPAAARMLPSPPATAPWMRVRALQAIRRWCRIPFSETRSRSATDTFTITGIIMGR